MRKVECARLRGTQNISLKSALEVRILTLGRTSKAQKNIVNNFKVSFHLQEEEVGEPLVPAVVLGALLPGHRVHPLVVFSLAMLVVRVADGAKMSAY